jgi:hypothetical protein
MPGSLQGLDNLNRKISLMKLGFDGRDLNKVALAGARVIADEARSNVRRGLTGNLARAIQAVGGKKASKYGAAAIARVNAWLAPEAHFIEGGTTEHGAAPWQAMKVPEAKMMYAQQQPSKTGRFKRGASFAYHVGFLFFRRVRGVTATHFFSDAVQSAMPAAQQTIEDGIAEILKDAIR